MKFRATYYLFLALVPWGAGAASAPSTTPTPSFGGSRSPEAPWHQAGETHDRNVDRAALSAQELSIGKYRTLYKKYQGTERDGAILVKLMDALEFAAGLEFRIAHGAAQRAKAAVNLTRYEAKLVDMIHNADLFLSKQPNAPEAARFLYARGQSKVELRRVAEGKEDYHTLTRRFPDSHWAVRGNLALADFAYKENAFAKAIEFLRRVEKKPESPYWPVALYQLAWCFYNLGDIPTAVSYLERNFRFYQAKRETPSTAESAGGLSAAETALLEHSLRDVVSFTFDGYERKLERFSFEEMLSLYRRYESGPYLGTMAVLFSKLLRSRDRSTDLSRWKDQVIEEEAGRPESLDVVLVEFEYRMQRREYDSIVRVANSLKTIDEKTATGMRKFPSYATAQTTVLDAASSLQKLTASEKNPKKAIDLTRIVAGLYGAFTAIVDETDPRLPQVHYNLAETLFRIREFDAATDEYLWVLTHWNRKSGLNLASVRLKAISSRYQGHLAKGLLPRNLKTAKLEGETDIDFEAIEKGQGEWIRWVDAYVREHGRDPAVHEFEFETNRVLYAKGQTVAAIRRLTAFVKDRPESKVAVPCASLVLDTYVHNEEWQKSLDAAEAFLELKPLGDAEFKSRIGKIPPDSYVRIIENAYKAEQYQEVLKLAGRFRKRYGDSSRLAETLFMAGIAARKLDEPQAARETLGELVRRFPDSSNRSLALLARAEMAEAEYDFDAAVGDYDEVLKGKTETISSEDRARVLERFFVLSWLSRRQRPLDCVRYGDKGDAARLCERYQPMILLELPSSAFDTAFALKRALLGPKENRAAWAAAALQRGKGIGFKDGLGLIQQLVKNFESLDVAFQLALIRVLNETLPRAFAAARRDLRDTARLQASPQAIARRIDLMKEVEKTAELAVGLPWAMPRIAALFEVAAMYDDFAVELKALKPPKGLTAQELQVYRNSIASILEPFREKEKTIRQKAWELVKALALSQSKLALHSAQAGRAPASVERPLDPKLFETLGESERWGASREGEPKERPKQLRSFWVEAVSRQAWGRSNYFLTELKEKKAIPDAGIALMRAITLDHAAAKHEAILELESARGSVSAAARRILGQELVTQYQATTLAGKAREIESELQAQEVKE